MLDNIIKYNNVNTQEAVDKYLTTMLQDLEQTTEFLRKNEASPSFAEGFDFCISQVRCWLNAER